MSKAIVNINPRKAQAIIDVEPGATGYIGASGIAAVLGMSEYTTKREAYLRFCGKAVAPTEEQKAVFERGHRAEEFISKEIEAKYGLRLRKCKGAYVHPKHKWWICHPDRLLVGRVDGKRIGVEIKSSSVYTSFKWGEEGTAEIPVDYICQCLGYMACGVCDEVWLFRCSDWRLTKYVIEYDEGRISMLEKALPPVVESYINGIEPSPSTLEECNQVWIDPKDTLEADKELADLCDTFQALRKTKKEVEEKLEEIKTTISLRLQDKKVITDQEGKKILSRIRIEKTLVDSKQLEEERPDIYEAYSHKSIQFQFR